MNFEVTEHSWPTSKARRLTAELKEFSEDSARTLEKTGKLNYSEKLNKNVLGVSIPHQPFFLRIPNNFHDFFPNLISLNVYDCGLKKISRLDFKNLINLKEIHLTYVKIEELPADLFADLKDLEIIDFKGNQINSIGKNIFKHLENLKFVDFRENPSIDFIYADTCYKFENIQSTLRIFKVKELNAILNGFFPSIPKPLLDIESVLKIDDFKDLTVKVCGTDFKVHKLMLAARSATLAEMIKNNPDAHEIIFDDIEGEIFKIILDFIYDDKMPQNYDENSQKVFATAGKFKLEQLKLKVGEMLCDAVTLENSFEMLNLACKHNYIELKLKSFEEIKKIFLDKNLTDDLMEKPEMLQKMIDAKNAYEKQLKEAEETMKRLKDDFEKLFPNGR